jgi:DUF4097 and DUF4098 domain-containing protein YvlB
MVPMQEFDTTAQVRTVLDVPAGRVRLVATDRAGAAVEVRPADAAKARDVAAAEQTAVEYADGVLRVAAPAKARYFGPSGAVEVTVRLPAGSRVEARSASAEFRGVGRLGEVTYEGSHGRVELEEAAGVHLTTLAGDVSVGRLGGPADIRTAKGDIRIAEAVRGTVVLRTEAGDVSVGAAAGVSAALDAGTGRGRIRNALRNTGAPVELDIRASTAHGDIAAHSA